MNRDWLNHEKAVGITAGASAPEVLVDDVIEALRRIGPVAVSVLPGREENIEFRLPAELTAGRTTPLPTPERKTVMAIPFFKEMPIGSYLIKQRFVGPNPQPPVRM